MGAEVAISLFAPTPELARAAARAAFDEIHAWDAALSDYAPDSEVASLPARAHDTAHPGPRLARALSASMAWHRDSGGAFDPALGRLTKLWRRAFRASAMPGADELALARRHSGARLVAWDADSGTVSFTVDGVQLDFGAIGQGLAADAAMDVLRAHGVEQALIDVSGDLLASAAPPGTAGWTIELEPEFADEATRTVTLAHGALCVSGDRGQPGFIDGRRLSHILDPATGCPIDTPRQSLVMAPSATEADGLATIACVLPVDALIAVARLHPQCAVAIERLPQDGGVRWIQRSGDPDAASARSADSP